MTSRVGYYDREGRFLYATPAMATLFGLTPDQLIGRTWYEIGMPPEVVDSLEALRRSVLTSGNPATTRIEFEANGTRRETEVEIRPALGDDGSVVGTVVTGRDAAEDEDASTRNVARLDRTYAILRAVDEVLIRTRDRNVILKELCRISADVGGFGMAWVGLLDPVTRDLPLTYKAGRDEGLLQTVKVSARDDPSGHGVMGTAVRENRTAIVQDVASESRMDPWRHVFEQLRYRTAAGFPIRVAGRPIGALGLYTSEAGHFDATEARLFEQVVDDVSGVLTQIETERAVAAAQTALAASEKRYRELFDVNPHPLAVVDAETLRFLEVNAAAVADYGYSREEFLAMTILDLSPKEDAADVLASIEKYRGFPGFRTTGPWRQRLKNGSIIKVEVSAHETDYNGRRASLLLAIDVTERERLQAQLTDVARLEAMGRLASGVAHDFNNLLTAINGYSDLLIAELGDDERAESAREVRRAGTRATELTRQILAFSRRLEAEPRAVDLGARVASVGQMLRRLIGENIRLVTTADEVPAVVKADPGQLDQILVNLAVNARDAMPDGGELRVSVRHLEDGSSFGRADIRPAVLLTVADTGQGMDEATLKRAFQPFFTTKKPGEGTGLGLATVRDHVRSFHGDVRIESTVGVGTSVFVLIPAAPEAPEPVALARLQPAPAGPRATILVVEDDQSVRSLVVAALERAGHRVLVAGSPAEAIALSEGLAEPIDLLLSDVVMPGGSGQDLAARLRAARSTLRVLMMSGYDLDAEGWHQHQGVAFLAKPFDPETLLSSVGESLAEQPATE